MTHLLDKVTCHVIVEEICPFENCYLVPRLAQVPGSTFSWWTLHIRPFTCCCSVTKSCLTLRPHGLQHALLLCPPLSPRVYSNSCPVILSKHLILCHPLLLLPSVFPSIRIFSSESALPSRWPEYWSFSFSICPSTEYSGLISFRTDCLIHLAVQETPKSLLQHHNSKVSLLQL